MDDVIVELRVSIDGKLFRKTYSVPSKKNTNLSLSELVARVAAHATANIMKEVEKNA